MRIKYAATLALLFCSVIFSYSQVPNCATTTSPLNGVSAVTTTGAKLTWNAPVGGGTVAGYYLFVGTDAGATNLYNGAKLGNVLTTTLGTLSCSQTYNWKVVPFNSTGSATGCSISSFSTNLSPAAVGVFANYTFSGNANDVSGNGNNGVLINSSTSVQDRNGNAGSAYYFNGINQEVQPTYSRIIPPTSFTLSLWFNTTATIGGKLLGFGSSSSGLSALSDRIIYISNSGTLYFEVYPGAVKTVSISGVNDGKWHQVVASLGTVNGLALYLDGNLVALNNTVTTAYNSYSSGNTGFWRIGYDNLNGLPNIPSTYYFNGVLDDITIYNRELSYNEAVSSYGAFYNAQGCTGSSLILNASSLVGATYNWSGPNSFSSTLRNPTVTGGVSVSSVGLYTLTVNQGLCSYNFNTTVIANPVISNNSITGSIYKCILLPSTLTGTAPIGGDGLLYTYLWQSSTTSSSTGFVPATGVNTGQNYLAPSVAASTWYRRITYSGGCSNISSPVLVSPLITNDLITSYPNSVCTGNPLTNFIGSTPIGGGGGYVYQWQSSTSSSTGFSFLYGQNSISYYPSTTLSVTSWFRRVVTTSGFCVDTSAAVQVNVISSSSVPGNPSVYGNGIWNVYGYNLQNNGNFPNPNSTYGGYTGFYTTAALLNFDTRPLMGNNSTATATNMNNVPGYQGCEIPLTNFSFAVKGTNIVTATGLYQVNLTYWDDEVTLTINNQNYYNNTSYSGSSTANLATGIGAYIGPLSPSSLIDLTLNQGGGGFGLAFTITQLTSTPSPLVAGSITGSLSVCASNTVSGFTSVTPASGGCAPIYTWQISTDSTNWTNLSNSNSASYSPTQSVYVKTWFRRAATDVCGSASVYSLPVVVNITTPPGNSSVFGINMWNSYAFQDVVWGVYAGYWTTNTDASGLGINSQNTYGYNSATSPSNSIAPYLPLSYLGCEISSQYYSVQYKRQGFPTGIYSLLINADDNVQIKINGYPVYQNPVNFYTGQACLCALTVTAWTGPLSSADQIEVDNINFGGPGKVILGFVTLTTTSTMTGGIIGYSTTNCVGDVPVPFSNITSAGGNCYVNPTTGYQWYSSLDSIHWAPITGANAAAYSTSIALTTTTYFIRVATDVCGYTATSNGISIRIGTPPTPSPTPTVGGTYGYGNINANGINSWNIYAYGGQNILSAANFSSATPPAITTSYAGYYQDSTLNFNTLNEWTYVSPNTDGRYSGPSAAITFPTSYSGCVVNTQYWTIWAKRTNLTPGTYSISVTNDDYADLFVNGQRVWYGGCCGTNSNVWVGTVSGSSLFDVRGSNVNGPGYLQVNFAPTTLPSFTLNPGTIGANQSICSGSVPAALTNVTSATSLCFINYQWKSSTDAVNWVSISNATSLGYTPLSPLTTTTYFVRYTTDACGNSLPSNILTVTVLPSISVGTANSSVSLSCSPASVQLQLSSISGGNGSYIYLWQSSTSSSTTGFSTYTPTGNFGLLWNGGPTVTQSTYFRVIVSSYTCSTVSSNAFLFTIITAPGIVQQPVNISACVGSNAFLVSSASGVNVGYIWQSCVSPCATGGYVNLISNGTFSGINSPTLTIIGSPTGVSNNVYRVLFTSCGSTLTSNGVNINLNQPPTINTQPVSTTICGNGIAVFNIAASGTALNYNWVSSSSLGGSFTNVVNGVPAGVTYGGANSNILTVTSTGPITYYYEVLVNSSSCAGISTSSVAAFIVNPPILGNTTTSVSNVVCTGTTAQLSGTTVTGGTGIYSYQWFSSPDNSTWAVITTGTSLNLNNRPATSTYYERTINSGVCTSTSTGTFITVNNNPTITLQPANIYACAGGNAIFTANATSSSTINYQWTVNTGTGYFNLSISSYYPSVTSPSLTITGVPSSFFSYQYKLSASNSCATVTSNAATFNTYSAPTFVIQPTSQVTCANSTFNMPYTITGYQSQVQWYINQGSGWVPVSNYGVNNFQGTTPTIGNSNNSFAENFYSTTPQYSLNGAQFQAVLTNFCNVATTSSIVTLTVQPAISNNSISVPQNICNGYPAGTLTGSNVTGGDGVNYTYQWYSSVDNVNFNSIPGASFINYYPGVMTTTSYYRRIVNSSNCVASTNSIPYNGYLAINVYPATKFVIQPTNAYACNGSNAVFTSSVAGLSVTYKWQYRTSTTSSFSDLISGVSYPGYTNGFTTSNNNLTYTNPPISVNGTQFRCVAQGNCIPPFDTSAVVTLYINPVPSITTQPQNVTACAASTANFAVVATAAGALNYSWLVNPGSGWSAVATTNPYFNATTSSLGVLASLGLSNYQYEVILTLGNCSVTSTGANLSVNSLVGITSQPTTSTVCGGSNTSFNVVATGSGLSYQWLTSANGGASWNYLLSVSPYSGANSSTLSITSTPGNLNGSLYAVIVSGSCNPAVTSTGAYLTVYSQPLIVSNPINRFVCSGGSTFFSVSATGLGLSYQWQVSSNSGSSWINLTNSVPYSNVTTNTLSISGVSVSMIGYQYQALVTATCFPTVTSTSATLTSAFASTWRGSVSSDWFNASNWCSTVPTTTSDVLIQTGTNYPPIITGTGAVCQNIVINTGASLSINGSNSLGVYGSWQNDGTFNSNNSTVIFNGSSTQSISGLSITPFYNVTVNNTVGTYLLNNQSVTSSFTLGNNAVFNANGNSLVLLSTPTNTARITTVPGSAHFYGNITMQRYVPAIPTLRLMSSAVNGSTLQDWKKTIPLTGIGGSANGFDDSPANINTVWYFNEAINAPTTYRYVGEPNAYQPLNVGSGYRVYVRGDRTTCCTFNLGALITVVAPTPSVMSVANPPNIGTINLPVSYTDYGAPFRDGTNLVGNPYPSEINWDASGWTKVNVDNALYMWDPNLPPNGQYFSYVAGVAVPARTNPGIIASSQGFFVKGSAPGTPPQLTVTESVKTVVSSFTSNFRTSSTDNIQNLIRLRLVDTSSVNFDEAAIRFVDGATANFDKDYDAYKFYNSVLNIYSNTAGNLDLSVNSLPLSFGATSIPLTIHSSEICKHSIQITNLESFSDSLDVFLKDYYLNTLTNVSNGGSYSFNVTSDSRTQGGARFELITARQQVVTGLGQSSVGAPVLKVYPNPTLGNSVSLDIYNLKDSNVSISVTDLTGNLVFSKLYISNLSSYFTTELNVFEKLPNGVYVVNAISEGINLTQKIIVIK